MLCLPDYPKSLADSASLRIASRNNRDFVAALS